MSLLFGETVYRPIYNFLIFVYNIIPFHDFGVAIIIVTLVLKFILIPLSRKQIESQKKMQEMQPKIKEIQEKHKGDKEKQSRALMEFYKQNKTNPFSGCLPTIFQLIFLIAIYQVLFNISKAGLLVDPKELYSFVSNPGQINQYFLGIIDLSKTINLNQLDIKVVPQLILIVLAAVAQYVQIKMITPKTVAQDKNSTPDISQVMSKQMMYFGPLLTLFIGIKFPAGLSLYWLVSTVFAIIQQMKVLQKEKNNS
ncbi:MAG TPA: YidC/Oxa1 family membrane protein insertase [Candidatus Moranbacteria bacterium]|nr:YidC/Oxa1 family membrane protein insertase [Candidatus Moranbacteria bacterium]